MPEQKKGGFHALEERIHHMHDDSEKPAERKADADVQKQAPREAAKEQAPKKK